MSTAAPSGRDETKRIIRKSHQKQGSTRVYVPEITWYENYVPRKIAGVDDFDIFEHCLHTGKNLLIEGPTGPGKTTSLMAFAAKTNLNFFSIPSAGNAEPSQLFGKWVPTSSGGWAWQDGSVTTIARTGGLLLINEVNFLPPNVASVLFGALDARREITLLDRDSEVIRMHRPSRKNIAGKVISRCWCDAPDDPYTCRPYWVLIAADMNPGYEGTRPLNKALANRFAIKLFWDYDPTVEQRLVASKSLRDMADKLRADHRRGKYRTPVSTNMLMELEGNLLALSKEFAATVFINSYPDGDRAAVKLVVDTHLDDIEKEVRAAQNRTSAGPPNFATATEDEIYQWRLTLKPGEVDPEWGIYMTDWDWTTEEGEGE